MAQTLSKPVLLDETGQEIVDKLDDIKDAIGASGEYIPIAIRVTTPPTKTSYLVGDTLDLTGMVVSLIASNGAMVDITSACVFVPSNGSTLTAQDTNISISYYWWKDDVTFTTDLSIEIKELLSITVTTPPSQTQYYVDDVLDLTGMVITANYGDGSTKNVTSDCTFNPANGATLNTSNTSIAITYTEGSVTKTATQSITVSVRIYGAEWDGSASTLWTRTDAAADFVDPVPYMYNQPSVTPSSPFDNIMPWSGMTKVEDTVAGSLVRIPKYYYKWTREGSKMKLQIASSQFEGSHVSPAHADRGDGNGERDYVYVGRYECSSNFKSETGVTRKTQYSLESFRTSIHNLGNDIWTFDFAMLWTIRMLYLVEFANWKSFHGLQSSIVNITGVTDSATYHTGFYFGGSASYVSQYRWIEKYNANVAEFIDGVYFDNADIYVINNPSLFNNSNNGVKVGERGGTLTEWGVGSGWTNPTQSGYEWALYINDYAVGTDETVYNTYCACDYRGSDDKNAYITNGTRGNRLFGANTILADDSSGTVGCRLMKLPANS